ncbi:MAG: hypothetical protein AAF289_19190 [Cyanobacteria bacterium P01_A01_bin.135]
MVNVRMNLEAEVQQALDTGEISTELAQYLATGSGELSDRDRKLLQLLEDAISSGHIHPFACSVCAS